MIDFWRIRLSVSSQRAHGKNGVVLASIRRDDVASTSIRRYFGTICPLMCFTVLSVKHIFLIKCDSLFLSVMRFFYKKCFKLRIVKNEMPVEYALRIRIT